VLDKLLEAMYLKVLVNIVVEREKCTVYIELLSKKALESSVEEQFDTTEFSTQVYDFITSYIKESPYYYISILDMSTSQGALPTCSKHDMDFYADLTVSEYRCHEDKWTYYTSKTDLDLTRKRYASVGLDYIFSPFSILVNFFDDKINGHLAMYILVQDSFLSLAIFENSQLLYAHHLDMMAKGGFETNDFRDDDAELLLNVDSSIELDDISVDEDAASVEDFSNIKDLDSLEEIDEFSESKDMEEELLEATEELPDADETQFNEDYQRFTLIQAAVGQFYKDEVYESRFVENVYVADCIGVTNDFKKYLEEEMFFNVYVRRADIALEVCELAKAELDI